MTAKRAARYVALLRGVNVPGRMVKMADLKRIFDELGFDQVATFIASGNIVFGSSRSGDAKLEAFIESGLKKTLGYEVAALIRTPTELADAARRNPFGRPVPPGARLFVGFLRETPALVIQRKVAAMSGDTDQFKIVGRELYWCCAVPSMKSIGLMAKLEKQVGMPVTFRNINTVRRLAEKYPPA